jgi:uncharacterized protein (TIGR02001 family)
MCQAIKRRVGALSTTTFHGTLLCAITSLQAQPAVAEPDRFTPDRFTPDGSTSDRSTPNRVTWGGSLSLSSDYVYRGLSQNERRPAALAEVHVRTESGWSMGMRAATVKRGLDSSTHAEIDLQLAHTWSFNPDWALQLSANHYFYPDGKRSQSYEYDEVIASLTYQNWLTVTAAWSPNTSRFEDAVVLKDKTARSYELTVLQPLSPSWSLFGGAGHYDLRELFGTGYWYWNTGFSYCQGNLQIDLSHIDTDHTADRLFAREGGKRRWIASLTWQF